MASSPSMQGPDAPSPRRIHADTETRPLVTEVRLQFTKEPPILAFVSVTLWGCFVVHDLRLLERRDGTRVVLMPRARGNDGRWSAVAHPVHEVTRRAIEGAVFSAYEQARPSLVPSVRATG